MPSFKLAKGFSLIELMIGLAIVGILAALALPSYDRHMMKSDRSEAYTLLNEIMQAQERFAADNGTYADAATITANLGYANPAATRTGYYNITASTCVAPAPVDLSRCVMLTATPPVGGKQLNDDNGNGGIITLNSLGTKVGW